MSFLTSSIQNRKKIADCYITTGNFFFIQHIFDIYFRVYRHDFEKSDE